MTSSVRALAAVACAFALICGAGATASCLRGNDVPEPVRAAVDRPSEAVRDARHFLDTYVDPDGRVVRRDQGGDTVSEGQAYALLLAVALGDQATFDRVWSWTAAHLQRPDALLAWRWVDGAVVDDEAAADADLDAAWALALAARRWPVGEYAQAARELAAAVGQLETAPLRDGATIVAAGPWALVGAQHGEPLVVNPSYASPVGDAVLAAGGFVDPATATARATGARLVITDLLDRRGTPTDWAWVAADGSMRTADGPTDAGPGRFGWDAVRVPLRFAASCEPADRALAARIWNAIEAGAGVDRLGDHPARLTAAAAAAAAAGDERAPALFDEASAAERRWSTYYGAALTALARLLVTTDRLGSCPLLADDR